MTTLTLFRTICIVGNIASGKSTLTRFLASEIPNSAAILESFDQNPFLEWNFQNPQRWAFTNAVRYFYDYIRVWHDAMADGVHAHYFIDAGAPTNRHVYGQHMLAEGIVTRAEYDFYETLCGVIECAFAYAPPDAYIFVETSPEACFDRMTARAQHETWAYQQPISLEYLRGLVTYFHAFRASLQAQKVPLLVLRNDTDEFQNPAKQRVIADTVKTFLNPAASLLVP